MGRVMCRWTPLYTKTFSISINNFLIHRKFKCWWSLFMHGWFYFSFDLVTVNDCWYFHCLQKVYLVQNSSTGIHAITSWWWRGKKCWRKLWTKVPIFLCWMPYFYISPASKKGKHVHNVCVATTAVIFVKISLY